MRRRRHGVRLVHHLTLVEDILSTLGTGQRLDILRLLADKPKHVSLLAEELFLDVRIVSKDLERLETCGFVVSEKCKTRRVYSLTSRVRVLRQDVMVQLVIHTKAGRWLLVNFDDGDPARVIEPPTNFVCN